MENPLLEEQFLGATKLLFKSFPWLVYSIAILMFAISSLILGQSLQAKSVEANYKLNQFLKYLYF